MHIALVHAMQASMPPIDAAFERHWPEAVRTNLLDDGLSASLAARGRLDGAMRDRFVRLGRYARLIGADAILFTCSAFGPCIEAVRDDLAPLPVRRPNEAMISEAAGMRGRLALVATFEPTLQTLPREFPTSVELVPVLVPGALEALARGDVETHDQLIAEASAVDGVDGIILAQFSAARAADAVRARTGRPVLTTPDAAVLELRRALSAGAPVGVRR